MGTREEVLAFTPDGAQTADSMKASKPLNTALLGRGVRMRTIYLSSARNDPQTTARAQWLSEKGAALRTVPVLPIRMLVVDRTWAVLPIDPQRTAVGACVLRSAGVVTALCALFEQVWQSAIPWGSRPGTHLPLSDQERALLQLLMQGDTDEQAGRKLGVSTRTVGRLAADLMTRLGARSRFQAGAMATARGWLAPE
jgi:DNA-binding CsgD family transcriptional regulator